MLRRTALTVILALPAAGGWAFAPLIPPAAEIQGIAPLHRAADLPPLPLTTETPSPTHLPLSTEVHITEVEVRGVTLISASTLEPLVATISGQETSIASLTTVANAITATYRQKGYFLARAVLPVQNLTSGHLIIEVLEGTKGEITLAGSPSLQHSKLVGHIVERLKASRFSQHDIETALMELNALPGVEATGNLSPTPGNPRITNLTITLKQNRVNGEIAFDNGGTRYLGPNQIETSLNVNNAVLRGLGWNDQLHLRTINTPALGELNYTEASWKLPLNSRGTSAEAGGLYSISKPGWTLADLDLTSHSSGWWVGLNQNLVNTRTTQWGVYSKLESNYAQSEAGGNTLTRDRTTPWRTGSTLTTADNAGGLNRLNVEYTMGTPMMNATREGSTFASRTRGSGTFSKIKAEAVRLQRLNAYWNFLIAGQGQFSSNALLAGEEFGFGGSNYGRGYQNNELLGEQGVAGKAELQLTFHPGFWWLPAYQLFGFYDAGAAWNKDRDTTEPNNAEARTSTGFGGRLRFSPTFGAELTLAKPLNHINTVTGQKDPVILFKLRKTFAGNLHEEKTKTP